MERHEKREGTGESEGGHAYLQRPDGETNKTVPAIVPATTQNQPKPTLGQPRGQRETLGRLATDRETWCALPLSLRCSGSTAGCQVQIRTDLSIEPPPMRVQLQFLAVVANSLEPAELRALYSVPRHGMGRFGFIG